MSDGWADALRFVDDIAAFAERATAEECRGAIDSVWPRWTGWSAANNRISLDPSGNVPLDPPTRPHDFGALFGQANQNYADDIATLQQHIAPGRIVVGNAVPYAPNVGFSENEGTLIYEEASKAGAAAGVRRVNAEWQKLKR